MPKRQARPLTEAQKQLVADNVKLVPHIVKTLPCSREMDSDELVSAGYIGLCHAARSYDPTLAAFSTYACVAIRSHMIRSYNEARKKGFSRLGRAAVLLHPMPKVQSLDVRMRTSDTYDGAGSTDSDIGNIMSNDIRMCGGVPVGNAVSICELVDVTMSDILAWCRVNLSEKQVAVFEMRQLQGLKFREIAKVINRSKQNVQQTYELALAKIRKHFVGQAWDTIGKKPAKSAN